MPKQVRVPQKSGEIALTIQRPEGDDKRHVYEVIDHNVSVPDDELPGFLRYVEGAEVTAGSPSKEK